MRTTNLATVPKYSQATELQRVLNREVTTFVTNSDGGWTIYTEQTMSEVQRVKIKRIVRNYLAGLEVQAV